MAQPQMRTSAVATGPSIAAPPATPPPAPDGLGQPVEGGVGRLLAGRGSTPFRLRVALLVTIVFALIFAVLGAYGVGKRQSSIDATRHAAAQLLAVQDIRVAVVQADSLASRLYLTGGAEDPAQRAQYVTFIDRATNELVQVGLALDLEGDQAEALASANADLASYAGLIEQARANNRQGFPVGTAYQRQANELATEVVDQLRVVEQGQRDAVDDELAAAHRAGSWLALAGWVLVIVIVLAAIWLAISFRRVLNIPLALGGIVVLVVLIAGTVVQGRAISDADDAVAGSLTTADLVAQARAAAYDAAAQEALTLINRGNGAANEAKWQSSSDIVEAALDAACADGRGSGDACNLGDPWTEYGTGHQEIRTRDDAGDWDTAVAISLGQSYGAADPNADLTVTVQPFATFATTSDKLVQTSSATATSALSATTDGLGLLRALVFLAGIVVVVLAIVGFGQRQREYR